MQELYGNYDYFITFEIKNVYQNIAFTLFANTHCGGYIRGLKIIHVSKRGHSSSKVSKIICREVLFPFASHKIRHREIQMGFAVTAK